MAVIVEEEFKDILWVSDMGQLHPTESSIPINLIINRLIRRFKGSAFNPISLLSLIIYWYVLKPQRKEKS